MGFATLSEDGGRTWSKPSIPPTLIAGSAKIWGQRTADGRFALVYTPDREMRYPLVLVHGDDGREFRDMRVVHGELPRRRYQRQIQGPRGRSTCAGWPSGPTTAPFADRQAMWLIYSVNKEDIWVSRVPLAGQAGGSRVSNRDEFEKAVPACRGARMESLQPEVGAGDVVG